MKHLNHRRSRSGASLVELLIYLGIAVVICGVSYSFLRSAMMLYAKNMSIVRSHTNIRSVLDRLSNNLEQAYTLPVLINTSGAVSPAPSAGLYYDRCLGDPYVVNNPGAGLPASATGVTVTRSVAPLASPPLPAPGDAIVIDDPTGSIRALIATSTPGAVNVATQLQPIVLTFTAGLGTAITWATGEVKTARLVHREAFLVVPGSDKSELRYFRNFEPMPVLTNPANFIVISNQISILAGETTPFSIDTVGTDRIVRASLFARSTDYSTWLANKQANEFNTFVRLNAALGSRLRPRQ